MQENQQPIQQPENLVVAPEPATRPNRFTIGPIYEPTKAQKIEVSEYH